MSTPGEKEDPTGCLCTEKQYGASYTYDDKGNVISMTDADGKNFKYTYDSKHNITKATSAANRIYHFAYDPYGNMTEQKTADASDSTSYMKISKTYTSDGNYPLKATDALGNVTNYEWMTQRKNMPIQPQRRFRQHRRKKTFTLTTVSGKINWLTSMEKH